MGKHKPSKLVRHKIDKQKRYACRKAKRKLYLGLRKDSHTGYKQGRNK